MHNIDHILKDAITRTASDIHITVGLPPIYRINGLLVNTDQPKLTTEDTLNISKCLTDTTQHNKFMEVGEYDFSYSLQGIGRFRVNIFKQRGSIGIAMRVINEEIPNLDQLGHPDIVKKLARNSRGLILVTGQTGSGKSTTLAAMIDLINSERSCHVLTLEDPIEYLHKHKKSMVNQREIHADTKSYANALRAALRADPDVILIGEMRDAETIGIAVTAAETGHLVLATLHTGDAAQSIDRIIDVFPPYQQQQIRVQLSLTLQGIISQQLIPRRDGTGRVVAMEIVTVTQALRNLIREGKSHQIYSIIETGSKYGMQSMDASLKALYSAGAISYEEATNRATNAALFANSNF